MKPFESTENYLECILMLGEKKPCVHSVDVAHQLGVSKPTVSVTMKRLRVKLGQPRCLKTVRSFGYRMEEDAP